MIPKEKERSPNVVVTVDESGVGQWCPGEVGDLPEWVQEGLLEIEESRSTFSTSVLPKPEERRH